MSNIPEVNDIKNLIDKYLLYKNRSGPPRGHKKFHPSAWGNCLRLMQYQRYDEMGFLPEKAEKREPMPRLCRIWGTGHSMHDRWREYFEDIGILRGYWKCANPFCAFTDGHGKTHPVDMQEFNKHKKHYLSRRRVHGMDNLQGCFRPAKCLCGYSEFTYEETDVINEKLNFSGHADMIIDFTQADFTKYDIRDAVIPDKPVVVDMKTIKADKFEELNEDGLPHHYYMVQLMIYANVLDCAYGILIYENKNTQETKSFKIERSSDELFPEVVRQANEMNAMMNVLDENGNVVHLLPPPRPLTKKSEECSWCQYKKMCHKSPIWNDPELETIRKDFYGKLLAPEK